MEKLIDLSKGYLPILLVITLISASVGLTAWLITMRGSVEQNARSISEINQQVKDVNTKLEVLQDMKTDIALIKQRLGVEKVPVEVGMGSR